MSREALLQALHGLQHNVHRLYEWMREVYEHLPHTLERKTKAFANMTHQGEGYCIVVPFDCYIRLVLAF